MAKALTIKSGAMSTDFLVPLLEALPAYAEFTLERSGLQRDIRVMARDRPCKGRRFTNLNSGTEWLDVTGKALYDLDVTSVVFHEFVTEVIG